MNGTALLSKQHIHLLAIFLSDEKHGSQQEPLNLAETGKDQYIRRDLSNEYRMTLGETLGSLTSTPHSLKPLRAQG
jgi:hypothetical protein